MKDYICEEIWKRDRINYLCDIIKQYNNDGLKDDPVTWQSVQELEKLLKE